jgi:hypothetical protein
MKQFIEIINKGLRFGGGYEETAGIPIKDIHHVEPTGFEDPCNPEKDDSFSGDDPILHCLVVMNDGKKYYSEETVMEFINRVNE